MDPRAAYRHSGYKSFAAGAPAAAGRPCGECGKPMTAGTDHRPSVDHLIALSDGGSNDPSNFRWVGLSCNRRKARR